MQTPGEFDKKRKQYLNAERLEKIQKALDAMGYLDNYKVTRPTDDDLATSRTPADAIFVNLIVDFLHFCARERPTPIELSSLQDLLETAYSLFEKEAQ